jgi:adenylate kinase family enzyme
MKRVAIFGNAGAGKSTLARELASITGLPLHVVDMLQFPGGKPVAHEEYLRRHDKLIQEVEWIIDGYGCTKSAWQRFEAADTLVHIDLPLAVHAYRVTKRMVKGFFRTPEGWPKGSPIFSSSMSSYRVLLPCHRRLTPKYRAYTSGVGGTKRVVHLRSKRDVKRFLAAMRTEFSRP